jgi:Zn-dependent M28 family amino/carboxypeptidase
MDQPWIILGAHYDTRFYANMDSDIEKQLQPVPGANDGASGVAVLLELARVLPDDLNKNIWLVFFDAEDQGSIEGWDWILGSRSFVKTLQSKPDAVVIVDMIGDKDLNVYYERNSDVGVQEEIWEIAAGLGYEKHFIPEYKYSMLDDHTPFLEKGMVAIDIIDFDYPYWHTSQDTIDKISPESLEMIGTTIYHWLLVP